jgi:hypothetical protein
MTDRTDFGDFEDTPEKTPELKTSAEEVTPKAELVTEAKTFALIDEPAPRPFLERMLWPELLLEVPKSICIVGPVATGKSAVTVAFKRVCDLGARGPNRLGLVCREGDFRGLYRKTIREQADPGEESTYEATQAPQRYVLHISGQVQPCWHRRPSRFSVQLQHHDVPGGVIPPHGKSTVSPFRGEVIEQAREAEALLICMDATQASAAYWEDEIMGFLEALVDHDALPAPRMKAGRVLLLFNHIDQVASRLAAKKQLRRSEDAAFDLSPLSIARDCIGEAGLDALGTLVGPRAQLVVGISSAFGFDIDGEPLVDDQGRVNAFDNGLTGHDLVKRWTPFGIREALLFLTTGEICSTVMPVATGA